MFATPECGPWAVSIGDVVHGALKGMGAPSLPQLGPGIPSPELLPVRRIGGMLASMVRRKGGFRACPMRPPASKSSTSRLPLFCLDRN